MHLGVLVELDNQAAIIRVTLCVCVSFPKWTMLTASLSTAVRVSCHRELTREEEEEKIIIVLMSVVSVAT